MIVVKNQLGATRSLVAASRFTTQADTAPPAGKGDGFRPHELLEAALASCMAITLRMAADERKLKLDAISVSVEVDRSSAKEATFRATIDLDGDLSDVDRKILMKAAQACPVRKTLSKCLSFVEVEASH